MIMMICTFSRSSQYNDIRVQIVSISTNPERDHLALAKEICFFDNLVAQVSCAQMLGRLKVPYPMCCSMIDVTGFLVKFALVFLTLLGLLKNGDHPKSWPRIGTPLAAGWKSQCP